MKRLISLIVSLALSLCCPSPVAAVSPSLRLEPPVAALPADTVRFAPGTPPAPDPALEPTPAPAPVIPLADYCYLYPDMYADAPTDAIAPAGTVYLTFDDGPSAHTQRCLDTLAQYGVKATFFVVGSCVDSEEGRERLRAISEGGHAIAVHCYSHDYHGIYASVESYLADFNRAYTLIHEVTGQYPNMFRFPGGSNTGYNSRVRRAVIDEMTRRGFVYYDWNVSAGDAAADATTATVIRNILGQVSLSRHNIVLGHDSHKITVNAVGTVVSTLLARGYTFDVLTHDVTPYQFAK